MCSLPDVSVSPNVNASAKHDDEHRNVRPMSGCCYCLSQIIPRLGLGAVYRIDKAMRCKAKRCHDVSIWSCFAALFIIQLELLPCFRAGRGRRAL